jgi:hypothetical protein
MMTLFIRTWAELKRKGERRWKTSMSYFTDSVSEKKQSKKYYVNNKRK